MFFELLSCFFLFSYVSSGYTFPHPLTSDEERQYLEKYKNGDENAKDILVERNLRLVAHVVKKYGNYIKDSEDLISIGTIGLIKGIATFRQDKGTKLATYAARCIDNEILMHLRSSKKYSNDVYLQDPIGIDSEGSEVKIEDKLADENDPVDEQVAQKIKIRQLSEAIKYVLQDRERLVILLRYGLKDGEEMTQREIAQVLGISRSYVSRIEKRALSKLGDEIKK